MACTAPGGRRTVPPRTRPVPMSGRRGARPAAARHGDQRLAGSVPVTTSISVAPGHRTASAPVAVTAGLATGQSSTYSSRWERWRRNPTAPRPSTATRTRLRQRSPSASPATGSTSTDRSRPARRASCSAMRNAFSRRCAPSSTCWKSHPPQRPGPACGHGGSTRSGEGVRISIGVGPQVGGGAGRHLGPDPLPGEAVADEDHLPVGGPGHAAPAGRDRRRPRAPGGRGSPGSPWQGSVGR